MTTEVAVNQTLSPALIEALAIAELPEVQWQLGDDLCDCAFQRIGMWKNPYIATQHEIRLCCIWAKLGEMFPQYVRTIPAYFNESKQEWDTSIMVWNGENEMPRALWHRQLARGFGISVAEARSLELPPPQGYASKPVFLLPQGGEYIEVRLG